MDDTKKVVTTLPKKYHFEDAPIVKPDGRKERRPNLYTDGRKKKILLALKAGANQKKAANHAGLSLSTLRNWLARGEAANDESGGVDQDMYLFAQACLEASANSAIYLIQHIMKGAADDPFVALKALPLLHPEDYGPNNGRITHEVEGQVDVVHSKQLNLEALTLEELKQLETIAERIENSDVIDAEVIEDKDE